ncbi:uncharacterized protein BT62DRAFT_1031457 [Guyanagaster necrorhizus]|uniref:F-box domain-containing protein n=1 Tax=Guyanagaster necrorhizus TaxID=856835 RepID=A0A9P7W3H9_9AGAR|nr:uncharacterized protein BT62DRAFT_1031457 [Guyanagaster necrorhizus MCA 3950]KAG7451967.1 hypothetical protein BT62DRAFT_1031457 [Guyanagaster necrorhizus MCA 3950]
MSTLAPLLDLGEVTYRSEAKASSPMIPVHTWPLLTCYEQVVDYYLFLRNSETSPWGGYNDFRFACLETFFLEMCGFYSGELDLTGRHKPRFLFLQPVWNEFIADFNITPYVEEQPGYGHSISRPEYTFHRPLLWQNFRSKWVVHENGYWFVKCRVAEVLRLMTKANYTPKFQRRHLLHLPDELLDLIMKNASLENTRIISSTCKSLRVISQRYIFVSRRLILNTLNLADVILLLEEKRQAATLERYLKEHDQSLSQVHFLLGRPDITQKIKTVHIRVRSVFDHSRGLYLGSGTFIHLETIEHAFCSVLETMQNLTSLSVSRFLLSNPFTQTIASLPHLRTLKLAIHAPITSLLCYPMWILNRIENLVLTIDPDGLQVLLFLDSWANSIKNLFIFYPHVPELDAFSNMCAMERVSLSSLPRIYVHVVENMLLISPSSDVRRLTHLKLDFREPILDEEVVTLSGALESYPMEVLVLDGLLQGYPDIIDAIAQKLPNLLVLMLLRRGGSAQSVSTHCMWPKPIWTYAPPFSQFTRLRHFEWNYQYFCDEVITPWSMLRLEGHNDQDVSVRPYLGYESDDHEDIEYALCGASVFKAYCRGPKLVMVYLHDPARSWWLIGEDGPIPDTAPHDRNLPALEWNPCMDEDYLEDSCKWW